MRIRSVVASSILVLLGIFLASSPASSPLAFSADQAPWAGAGNAGNMPSSGGLPAVSSISPSTFSAGINTPVIISGQGLGAVTSAALGTTALRNVQVISSTQVSALVPWSIPPGSYGLEVSTSEGLTVSWASAVTVTAPASGWTSSGPFGGDLWDVVVDPVDPANVYVSAQRSGLFKSTSGGAGWAMSLMRSFPLRTQIAYTDTNRAPVIYIAGDGGMGMERSLDYGQTWEPKVPAEFSACQSSGGCVATVFVRSDLPEWVYLGLSASSDADPNSGLYRSTNLGETWAVVSGTGSWNVTALAFDPDGGGQNMTIGAKEGRIYTTTTGAESWGAPVSLAGFIGQLQYAPNPFDGKRALWAIAGNSNSGGEDTAYRSTDGGATWTTIVVQPGAQNNGVSYHDSLPGLLWASVGAGYRSEDDGATWTPIGAGLDRLQSIAVVPGASSWQSTTLLAATRGSLYVSTDGGGSWVESAAGLGAVLPRSTAVSPFNADEAYVATQTKGFFRTGDGGRTWQSLTIPMGNYRAPIATDPFTDGKVYFSHGNFQNSPTFRISTNRGVTYTEVALTLPAAYSATQSYVSAIAPDPTVHDRLLAGVCAGATGPQVGPGFLYASSDGGQTWIQQSTPAGVRCILRLAFDPQNANVVYAGTNGTGLLRSIDGGATWTLLTHQPGGTEIGAIAVDPRDAASIYVMSYSFSNSSSEVGVFATHDGGDTWTKMDGLADYPIWELKLVRVGGGYRLYAATMNGLRYLEPVPSAPSTPWKRGTGAAETATIDGFGAGVEDGRVVLYIGTSGGTLPTAQAMRTSAPAAGGSLLIPGGVYRSMIRTYAVWLPLVAREAVAATALAGAR